MGCACLHLHAIGDRYSSHFQRYANIRGAVVDAW